MVAEPFEESDQCSSTTTATSPASRASRRPAAYGIDRPTELPYAVDVFIIGSGPAGMLAAAQLAQFPSVKTHLIERRPGCLKLGQADGVQARSVETFHAFGFAEAIAAEAYHITEMSSWTPDPKNPGHIIRTGRTLDDPSHELSEFPHLCVNQARVLDYFAQAAQRAPGRITPDYGWEFLSLEVGDGAHSRVRKSIGRVPHGDKANHAWGVMDVTVKTDFPDWRLKATIHSEKGSILHIPREGGHLCRIYVDLGEVPVDDNHAVRNTPVEEVIRRANEIYAPYSIDVQNVAWSSVYEVGTASLTSSTRSTTATRSRRTRTCSSAATPATPTRRRPARA